MNLDPAPLHTLGLDDWQAARANWPAGQAVAVRLPNDADPELLRDDLARISAVLLEFPKWTDGRAYSQAWLLRARLGYTGEVRATGDVLVDMAPLLRRTGFDAAVLRPGQSRQAALYALGFFDGHYQRDAVAG